MATTTHGELCSATALLRFTKSLTIDRTLVGYPIRSAPVVQFHFNWKHVSAIAGLTRTNFLFRLCGGAVESEQIVEFLKALRSQLKRRLLIVRDGAAQHRSRIVREYLDSTRGAIQMALPPGYAPDLNPVEYLWAWLKRHAPANFWPRFPERTPDHRPQQAAHRPAQTTNHHRVLEAGRALVMSCVR